MALALAALTGCGGPGEGDVWVYRVAVGALQENVACYYPDEELPPDVASDSSSLFTSSTWVLFVAPGGDLFLDVEGYALVGDSDDDGYFFETVATDVSFIGADQSEAVLTRTTHTTVDMRTQGSAVDGELAQRVITRCDFLTATPSGDVCPAPPPPECVRKAAFSGVRLKDVEITEGVDKSPSDQATPP